MQKQTKMLIFSFGLSAALVVGTIGFSGTSEANENGGMMNMMNGNGMGNMMEAMNSAEGQEMMKTCSKFMSVDEKEVSQ
ncbi:hypothetical protein [Halalkalibacter urbisdiaboli]|uniref:hypothetical protein n=1 Tax=Halalkalibacter urbisdiaboli TaxID=1960589 RepID=UPI000B45105A|nr:hypothetical protein [Halalkalibacter urbisdiaboli]